MDASVSVEAGSDSGGYAAGCFSEDAFGLGKLLNGGDDLDVGDVLGPSAGGANGARGVGTVGWVADGQRTRDGVGTLRLNQVGAVLDRAGDGLAAGSLRSKELDGAVFNQAEGDQFTKCLLNLGNQ